VSSSFPFEFVLRRHNWIAIRAPGFFANLAETVTRIFRVQTRPALT
jgi:hypothetical protein